MTSEKAALLLAKMDNFQNDPEQERLNLLQFYGRAPNGTSGDVLDALAAEARQELLDTIARPA